MRYEHEITCRIVPDNTPLIIRHCSKCNKSMEFYCSEKFRVNSNGARSDIWLIYKCTKCDSTWKATIAKGIKPNDLPPDKFDRFTHNDPDLAWEYAFNRSFLKQQSCGIDYSGVKYRVEGAENLKFPLLLRMRCDYDFDLKLSKFLAGVLGVSVGQVKKLAKAGAIKTVPECDVLRCKIRGDVMCAIQATSENL
ncbi:MAG: DUF1062 domain-containing protein [Defluviitaleaceae bacterium]|nr:DUF1062 domain-containing protein [Defluviitaleaceae bacterium]